MGPHVKQVALLGVLGLLACLQKGYAKVFEVNWDIPENGLILPSVSTAKCGDTVRFKCPPHATHGVFRMTSFNGTCPKSFEIQSSGVVLSAPTQGCDFSLVLGDEPDFFVASHSGDDCHKNLKMNIHSVCPQVAATSASNMLGMNSVASWSAGTLGGSGAYNQLAPSGVHVGPMHGGSLQGSSMGALNSLESNHGVVNTMGQLPPGLQLPRNQDYSTLGMDMEAGSVTNAAGMSFAGVVGAAMTAAAAAAAALVL